MNFPFAANEFGLREMLKDFVVPSLIVTDAGDAKRDHPPAGGGGVERLFGNDRRPA